MGTRHAPARTACGCVRGAPSTGERTGAAILDATTGGADKAAFSSGVEVSACSSELMDLRELWAVRDERDYEGVLFWTAAEATVRRLPHAPERWREKEWGRAVLSVGAGIHPGAPRISATGCPARTNGPTRAALRLSGLRRFRG